MNTLDENIITTPNQQNPKLSQQERNQVIRNAIICCLIAAGNGSLFFHFIPFIFEFGIGLPGIASSTNTVTNGLSAIEFVLRIQLVFYLPYLIFLYLSYKSILQKDYDWHFNGSMIYFLSTSVLCSVILLFLGRGSIFLILLGLLYAGLLSLAYNSASNRLWKTRKTRNKILIVLLPIFITLCHAPIWIFFFLIK
ncbi:MAG: hypothetical protein MK212_15720 [Saprospiraceae bacterium]|nr:hypothetical protein [Saprospiraceae bacterium]